MLNSLNFSLSKLALWDISIFIKISQLDSKLEKDYKHFLLG
jgi:hypothetical protein